MIQKLWIEGRLPGMNEIVAASKKLHGGWSGYNQLKRKFQRDIFMQIKAQRILPMQHAKIVFTWIEPNEKRDKDNIAAGKKFILDAMVYAGILDNDGWKNVICWEDHFYLTSASKRVGVMVSLEEVKPQDVKNNEVVL